MAYFNFYIDTINIEILTSETVNSTVIGEEGICKCSTIDKRCRLEKYNRIRIHNKVYTLE